MNQVKVYTIGHSNLPIERFISELKKNGIGTLVDIRSIPGSNANPQFNAEKLKRSLEENGIAYIWMKNLGGRRYGLGRKSPNKCWKNQSFRGYADYMETDNFKKGAESLISLAKGSVACIMCGESLYWRCHRVMVSDYLKSKKVKVLHIVGTGKPTLHKYTECARIRHGELSYR